VDIKYRVYRFAVFLSEIGGHMERENPVNAFGDRDRGNRTGKMDTGVPQWEAMFGIIVLGVGVVGALFIKARIATYIHNL
jgi:hypothetical protein